MLRSYFSIIRDTVRGRLVGESINQKVFMENLLYDRLYNYTVMHKAWF